MYFTGPYLRITTPKTTNGMIPQIINGEPQYSETFVPLTARKQFEAKNRRLTKNGFRHLVMEIEVVGNSVSVPQKRKTKSK